MASVNRVILLGNLGRDPEVRYMASGEAVANISLATTDTWKDKGGDKQERTEWHRVVFYRRLAEVAGEFLKKGSQIYIEGRIQTRKWQDKEGQDRYATEIIADHMTMLRTDRAGGGDGSDPPPATKASDYAKATGRDASRPSRAPSKFDDLEDDIPF